MIGSCDKQFEAKYIPEPNSGCWLWFGAVNREGYGCLRIKGRAIYAHRISYETAKGPLTQGMVIDHLCRIPCCVNPDHLEQVTPSLNVMRGIRGSRHRTTCNHGHPWNEKNTWLNAKTGWRQCRVCNRDNQRRKTLREQMA